LDEKVIIYVETYLSNRKTVCIVP